MEKLLKRLKIVTLAIVQNPLIGTSKKSIGNTTLCRRKGQNVMKAKIPSYIKPPNVAQTDNRNQFEGINKLAARWSIVLDYGYVSSKAKLIARNVFVKNNKTKIDSATKQIAASELPNITVSNDNYPVGPYLTVTKNALDMDFDLTNTASLPLPKIPLYVSIAAFNPVTNETFVLPKQAIVDGVTLNILDTAFGTDFANVDCAIYAFVHNNYFSSQTLYTSV